MELRDGNRDEIVAEVQRLKAAKQQAVEDEDYEEAAALKRRLGILEAVLSEHRCNKTGGTGGQPNNTSGSTRTARPPHAGIPKCPPAASKALIDTEPAVGCIRLVVVRRAVLYPSGGIVEWPDEFILVAPVAAPLKPKLRQFLNARDLRGFGHVQVQAIGGDPAAWRGAEESPADLGLEDGAQLHVLVAAVPSRRGVRLAWWHGELPPDYVADDPPADGDVEHLRAAADAHAEAQELQPAVAGYTRALALAGDPEVRAAIFAGRSACHAGLRRPLRSLRDANAAARLRPGWAEAIRQQASALALCGQHMEAYYCCLRANDVDSRRPPAPNLLRATSDLSARSASQAAFLASLSGAGDGQPPAPAYLQARPELSKLCALLQSMESPELSEGAHQLMRSWLAGGPPGGRSAAHQRVDDDLLGCQGPWAEAFMHTGDTDARDLEGAAGTPPTASARLRLCTSFLTQPLTAIHALQCLQPEQALEHGRADGSLVLHIVGAREREGGLEAVGADDKWDAVADAYPDAAIRIFLVGPEMDTGAPAASARHGRRLLIHRVRQAYEDFFAREEIPLPDLVLCQHPGLHSAELFQQWLPAVKLMLDRALPVAWTMYDQYEWLRTMWMCDVQRIRLEVLFMGRNPYGSLFFRILEREGVAYSANQWIVVFKGGRYEEALW